MAILFSLLEWSLFEFSLRDFLDVLVVAGFLYVILLLLKKTHSLFLFNGIGLLFILYAAAREEMVRKSEQMGVPVIDIDGEMVVGFDKEQLSELLKIS